MKLLRRNRVDRPAGDGAARDHALVMRDILHEWHKAENLYSMPRGA